MNNIDGVTAGMILGSLTTTVVDDCSLSVVKEIVNSYDESPTQEQIDIVNQLMGKTVYIKGTGGMYGVVVGLNTASRGFYPGGRYPAYVKIADDVVCGEGAGMTFEYSLYFILTEKETM